MSLLPVGPIHHLRLTVTDVERSKAFYTEVLGFAVAMDAPPPPEDPNSAVLEDSLQGGVILMHEGMFVGLRPVGEEHRDRSDRFDPLRVGLDHLSFAVPSRADLETANDLHMVTSVTAGLSQVHPWARTSSRSEW